MKRHWQIRRQFQPTAAEHDGGIKPTNTSWIGPRPTNSTSVPPLYPCTDHRRRTYRRTAIYARVSTERQTLAPTLAQQVARLTAHVDSQGETLLPEASSVMMAIVVPPSIGRGWIACGIGSQRPPLTGSSSPVPIGWPATMSITWSSWKSSHRPAVASSSWISLWDRIRQTISCCKSGGPWQNTNGR